jgi:hypothetical protein
LLQASTKELMAGGSRFRITRNPSHSNRAALRSYTGGPALSRSRCSHALMTCGAMPGAFFIDG